MTRNNPIFEDMLKLIIAGMVTLLWMTSCKTTIPTLPTNTASRDSVRVELKHDSIYIDRWHTEYMRGDTLIIRDSIYRDRWHVRHDSIYFASVDTIYKQVVVEKKGSTFLRNSGIALWVLLALLLLATIAGIVIKFAK